LTGLLFRGPGVLGDRGRFLAEGGRPAAEETKRVLVLGAGLGGEGEDGQPGVGHEVEAVVGEVEVADDGVVEVLTPVMCWRTSCTALGHAVHVAALQAGVVGDADAGEDGDLFAAKAGDATPPVGGQADLVGRELGPA
jgi:hypothetical protein